MHCWVQGKGGWEYHALWQSRRRRARNLFHGDILLEHFVFFLATRHLYEIPVKALKLELEDGSAVRWNSLAWRQVPLFLGNT